MVVIDDHLLLRALLGTVPLDEPGRMLATTTTWWWRLSSAVRKEGPSRSLSTPFHGLGVEARGELLRTLDALPELLEVCDLRARLPLVADVAQLYRLNLLAAEALAMALLNDAEIHVAVDGRLGPAARAAGVPYAVVGRSE